MDSVIQEKGKFISIDFCTKIHKISSIDGQSSYYFENGKICRYIKEQGKEINNLKVDFNTNNIVHGAFVEPCYIIAPLSKNYYAFYPARNVIIKKGKVKFFAIVLFTKLDLEKNN